MDKDIIDKSMYGVCVWTKVALQQSQYWFQIDTKESVRKQTAERPVVGDGMGDKGIHYGDIQRV